MPSDDDARGSQGRITPMTGEEVQQLFAANDWAGLIRRLQEHFDCMAPLLPQILPTLSATERERFLILFLDIVKVTDGAVH